MSRKRQEGHSVGKVYLVGSGPGHPGLATIRAIEVLKKVDVVIYDHLVGKDIMGMIPPGVERIDAGKCGSRHKLQQDDINELMAKRALAGQTVARLKGGDPYLFGRGGEEAEFLLAKGVKVEVVPGVTSALAVPAAAGIPVTHRDFASAVTIVTGHDSPTKKGGRVDWAGIAHLDSTIVVLMGMKNLGRIAARLMSEGKPGDTPVAIIEKGTRSDQVVTVGDLKTIHRKAREAGAKAPAIIVIGDVVRLRARLGGKP